MTLFSRHPAGLRARPDAAPPGGVRPALAAAILAGTSALALIGGQAHASADATPPPLIAETIEPSLDVADLQATLGEPAVEPRPTQPPLAGRTADGLALHVLRYVYLIEWAAGYQGVDPAVVAALMEVEGSGENAISSAGALGLMQLMPDKLYDGDDPFDPATNIWRATQLVARLERAWQGDLAAVAGSYFGAVDSEGRVTDDTDGITIGSEYVRRFAAAYERWAVALGQPVRPVEPRVAPRPTPALPTNTELAADIGVEPQDSPERDRWYLYLDRPQPAIPPIYY